MDISLPRERRPDEYRAALAPAGVETLVKAGHRLFVEHNAGQGAGFSDEDYSGAGARIVYSQEEAYGRGQLVAKVARPTVEELQLMHGDQILVGFLHLAAGRRDKVDILRARNVCAIGWETVERDDGCLTVLQSISAIAGRLMPQIVGRFLQSNEGGRGVILSGTYSVPPAEVVILGAGTFGTEAALALAGNRASVYVLDVNADALIRCHHRLAGRGITMAMTDANLRKVVGFADAIIGAVYVPGQRAPVVLRREHLRMMRRRCLFVDASIDQGGCAETSRPTTHSDPTYTEEGIIHYCVPNITSLVGRTATHALSYATVPYLLALANLGLERALAAYGELGRGVNVREGQIVHPGLTGATRSEAER